MLCRFQYGATLAGEVRALGWPGDAGYQTFLYPTMLEIR